jgi:hypothetical protein
VLKSHGTLSTPAAKTKPGLEGAHGPGSDVGVAPPERLVDLTGGIVVRSTWLNDASQQALRMTGEICLGNTIDP